MSKISTRVTFDKRKAEALIKASMNDALTVMGNQALQDVSQYVPKDQHTLENSGLTHSDQKAQDFKFKMRWCAVLMAWGCDVWEPDYSYLWT